MKSFYNPDRYPYWYFFQKVLSPGVPGLNFAIPTNRSADYLLEYVTIDYNSIGDQDPTTFSNVQIQITDLCRSSRRFNTPTPVMLISTPGIYENFPVGYKGNGQVFKSMPIDRLFFKMSSFEISLNNFVNTTNDITINILLEGQNVLNRGIDRI